MSHAQVIKGHSPLALRARLFTRPTYQPTWGMGEMRKINSTSYYTARPQCSERIMLTKCGRPQGGGGLVKCGQEAGGRNTGHFLQEYFMDDPMPLTRQGSSIYDVHKRIRFLTPSSLSTCVHLDWTPSHPCDRPHTVDMKYTLLS